MKDIKVPFWDRKVSIKDDYVQIVLPSPAKTYCGGVIPPQPTKASLFTLICSHYKRLHKAAHPGPRALPSGKGDTQNLFRYIFSRLALAPNAQLERYHGLLAGC